jgi:hypothetical protein
VGFALPILNYIMFGFTSPVDDFSGHSFVIWLAFTIFFPCMSTLGFVLLEYRLGHRSILSAFKENFKWLPFFILFFGGMAIHLSQALLAHLFSYDITWGATRKVWFVIIEHNPVTNLSTGG